MPIGSIHFGAVNVSTMKYNTLGTGNEAALYGCCTGQEAEALQDCFTREKLPASHPFQLFIRKAPEPEIVLVGSDISPSRRTVCITGGSGSVQQALLTNVATILNGIFGDTPETNSTGQAAERLIRKVVERLATSETLQRQPVRELLSKLTPAEKET